MLRIILATGLAISAVAADVASGTGFAVHPDGYVLTNAHVVADCASVVAVTGGASMPAQIVAKDTSSDLALLKVARRFSSGLPLREGMRVQLGESVVVFGYPLQGVLATSLNMTTGNISALAGLGDDARSLQFTAPIQPGNSGGPLVDASGNVVGIVTSKLSPLWASRNIGDIPQNVNFAIKTSAIRDFLESRNVEVRGGSLGPVISVTELPAKVSDAVMPLQCIRGPQGSSVLSKGSADGGILFVALRTQNHQARSNPEVFQRAVDDVLLFLKQQNLRLSNDEFGRTLQTEKAISTYEVVAAAKRVGAAYVMILTVDRPFSSWIRLQLECLSSDGKVVWKEESQDSGLTSNGAIQDTLTKLEKKVKERIGKTPLPRDE